MSLESINNVFEQLTIDNGQGTMDNNEETNTFPVHDLLYYFIKN